MRSVRRFTPEEDELVREAAELDLPWLHIAQQTGRCRSTIIGRARYLGVWRPRGRAYFNRQWRPEYAARMRYLLSCGASDKEIARHFGVSYKTIGGWRLKYLSFTRRSPQRPRIDWTALRVQALTEALRKGLSARETAVAIAGSEDYRNAVIGKAHRLGLSWRAAA